MEWWMVLCGKGDEATPILIGRAPAGMARGQIGVCPGFRLPRPSRRSGDGTVRAQRPRTKGVVVRLSAGMSSSEVRDDTCIAAWLLRPYHGLFRVRRGSSCSTVVQILSLFTGRGATAGLVARKMYNCIYSRWDRSTPSDLDRASARVRADKAGAVAHASCPRQISHRNLLPVSKLLL